jgi:chemotaxis methyl-accepting protein methylase
MTRRRRTHAVAAALLALLVALGAAGCGGGSDRLSKSDYEKQVQAIGSDLRTSLSGFNSNSQDLGALETKVGQAQVKLQSAAGKLKALKAPSDAADDNTKLANALSSLAAVFNNLKQALAAKDISKIQQTAKDFQSSPAAKDVQTATQDLKKKGYDIGVLGAS